MNRYSTAKQDQHPIKRLREDSETSITSSANVSPYTLKDADYIKKMTLMEMQVTKLKEENSKIRIEQDTRYQQKHLTSLREDEDAKNSLDKIVSQRNVLYEKNTELSEELDEISETYRKYHHEMSEKKNQLLSELSDLKTKLLEVTDNLDSQQRKSSRQLCTLQNKLHEEITERDCKILSIQNECKMQKMTIDMLQNDLESIRQKTADYSDLHKSEFKLRMELDSIKDKEIYASIFPDKIVKSNQIQEENCRLQREIKNLRGGKENSNLLKMQLEDAQKEIDSLKTQLADYHTLKDKNDSLRSELRDWDKVKLDLGMTNPLSIVSTVSKLQKDSFHMTSSIEKLETDKQAVDLEMVQLLSDYDQLKVHSDGYEEQNQEFQSKVRSLEMVCNQYKDEAASCKKLLETYQTSNELERQSLPSKAGSKILHMKHNPYQTKLDSELKRISEENTKLKQHIESLDKSGAVKELDRYKQRLHEAESELKKTRKIYQGTVKTFKEGIFDLFGYSVTCPAEDQFSLLSVFAESQDNTVMFLRENKCMQLMENGFTKTLQMQSHISKLSQHRSIPLFLADITSDLFHCQTVAVGEMTCEFGGYNQVGQ